MSKTSKSLNPSPEDEFASIDAQLDHVNRVLKWSILDLEKFTFSLKARLVAEEAYVAALTKITRHNTIDSAPTHNNNNGSADTSYFGDYTTSFTQTASTYENSIEKTVDSRREFISCLKSQIELLQKVKDSHDQRRKKVKAVLGEKNANYITFRTRDIVKLQKSYVNKCNEYANIQQQILIANHEDSTDHHLSPVMMARASSEEPRVSNDSGRDDQSILSQDTIAVNNKKNSMAGFITQMRSQLASAAAATTDPSKQTARLAKLKKEIHDADGEYRQGVRLLEFLRKKQVETALHAMRHVEAILLGKSDAVKAVMVTLSKQEEDTLLTQVDLIKHSLGTIYSMDGQRDTDKFLFEYEKIGFIKPRRMYYENYYYGRCKEILFGSNLNDYFAEHERSVPLLVTKCIEGVEMQGGLEKEGIYRISGRQTNVDALKNEFEKDEEAANLENNRYDVFTIASVLKIYLRELKQPLFNLSMQDRIQYSKITNDVERTNLLVTKLSEASKPQRDTLEAIIRHLAKVQECSQANKMTIKNLSVIFTPALFHDHNQVENAGEWYSDIVLQDLIQQHESIFSKTTVAQQQPKNPFDSPSSSVLSLPFTMGGVPPIVRRPTNMKQ
ncbi:hypothetical protein INT47_001199 [Mucor saturninus]|uniref:Rho-GAP domain-containing protein n=1 Tax=Mucor saturninus TaxID=64648 RepID=A0A8H7RNX6_9FUNG|nr:hypothetical protein INT47_001199 [Mucor saturninus]